MGGAGSGLTAEAGSLAAPLGVGSTYGPGNHNVPSGLPGSGELIPVAAPAAVAKSTPAVKAGMMMICPRLSRIENYPSSRCSSIASPNSVATPEGVQAANVTGMESDNPKAKTMSEKK